VTERDFPTARPLSLGIGVFPQGDVVTRFASLGPALAQDLAAALLLDSLGALSTFPVRHRVVFVDGDDSVSRQVRLPTSWREVAQRGRTAAERERAAFEELTNRGAEAVLLVSGEGPSLPLGPLYDALVWAHTRGRVAFGMREAGGAFALATAERTALGDGASPLGLVGLHDDALSPLGAARLQDQARASGLDVLEMPAIARVEGMSSIDRVRADVAAGAFAPHTRKLLARADWPAS
jgi:hypothetical protein